MIKASSHFFPTAPFITTFLSLYKEKYASHTYVNDLSMVHDFTVSKFLTQKLKGHLEIV